MIPICDGQTLDVSFGGVTYKLAYLTERSRMIQFEKLTRKERAMREPFLAKAREQAGPDAPEQAVSLLAYEALSQHREEHPEDALEIASEYVDIFCVGWDAPVAFPADGRPSKMLRLYNLTRLSSEVSRNLVELTGLTVDEAKN